MCREDMWCKSEKRNYWIKGTPNRDSDLIVKKVKKGKLTTERCKDALLS